MMENMDMHYKIASKLSNEQVLKAIETPENIEVEFYDALILVANERELGFDDSVESNTDQPEIEKVENSLNSFSETPIYESEWQCPQCKQMISQDYTTCWNCHFDRVKFSEMEQDASQIGQKIELNQKTLGKNGLKLVGMGIVLFGLSYFRVFSFFRYSQISGLVFGSFAVIFGVLFIILDLIDKKKESKSTQNPKG